MPAMNQAGPQGAGPMTGRGLGRCNNSDAAQPIFTRGRGMGMGRRNCGRGCGQRGFYAAPNNTPEQQKDMLKQQKAYLQSQLENVDKQIEEL